MVVIGIAEHRDEGLDATGNAYLFSLLIAHKGHGLKALDKAVNGGRSLLKGHEFVLRFLRFPGNLLILLPLRIFLLLAKRRLPQLYLALHCLDHLLLRTSGRILCSESGLFALLLPLLLLEGSVDHVLQLCFPPCATWRSRLLLLTLLLQSRGLLLCQTTRFRLLRPSLTLLPFQLLLFR